MAKYRNKTTLGFSPLEVMAVAALVGIIAAIVLPRLGGTPTTTAEALRDQHHEIINSAVDQWYVDHQGTWPKLDLSDIGRQATYFPEGVPIDPVTGQNYSLNSTTHRVR